MYRPAVEADNPAFPYHLTSSQKAVIALRICELVRRPNETDRQIVKRAYYTLVRDGQFPTRTSGYVYVVTDTTKPELYKIGRTNSLRRRIEQLSRTTDGTLRLLLSIQTDDMFALETKLHRRYRAYRKDGEWFRLPPLALNEILDEA